MKEKTFYAIIMSILCFTGCAQSDTNLYLKENNENEQGYVNSKGEIIIPYGKYSRCFTDTIKYFGIVADNEKGLIGIDKKGKFLFEVFKYDNGPDYISEGMFRFLKDGKIGYANEKGEIVIEAKYNCAWPFDNGKAKVSLECFDVKMEEHTIWESDAWFYIDKKGNVVEE